MRKGKFAKTAPVVGIFVDGVTGFGRDIMRGVMRFANLQRRWHIYESLRNEFIPSRWPKFDAAILAGTLPAITDHLMQHCRNVVRCSGNGDPKLCGVICLDDVAIGKTAAQHLLDTRLTNFGFYGRGAALLSQRRFQGFRDTVVARGYTCSDAGVGWSTAVESGITDYRPSLIAWLQSLPKPVGILAVDDSAAHDLAAACREVGLAVPHQVAIVGVNNDDLLCESAWPPVSSVEGDYSRVGYEAARMAERMLAKGKPPLAQRMVVLQPFGVVQRQSSELLAVDDPQLAAAIQFIREHACDPCNVSDVLKHVPVGRRWLERQFIAKLGRTPHDEIMHVRIEAAKRMLLRPELKIPEIAERIGHSAVQNFNRAFEQIIGKTPAVWRREALSGGRSTATR